MINFWNYTNEYKLINKQILKSVDKTLKRGNIFFGLEIKKFEKNFLKSNNLKYGLAVGSGTEAIYLALKALNIKKNDEVITVANTAIPTAAAIVMAGAIPRFVDVKDDYLINEKKIEEKINKKTKAIIIVHLYGNVCNMNEIIKISKKYDLKIIEDCAQAQGAKINSNFVGSFGDLGCFSFYPTKILGAYGDGGFVTTKSKKTLNKIKKLRFYGINYDYNKNFKYYAHEKGINSRLDEIQASILNIKIKKINFLINTRKKLAKLYFSKLKNTSLRLPVVNDINKHVYHLFVVYHPKRNIILKKLRKLNIGTNINYRIPLHKMKAYKEYVCNNCDCLPNTEKFAKGIFSLPLHPYLKLRDIIFICNSLKKILNTIK